MTNQSRYLLDADSFIRAKRQHYAFDFCPGYWDALVRGFKRKRLLSVAPVRDEIKRGDDELTEWAENEAPESFFESVQDDDVQKVYADLMQWAKDSDQFTEAAKQKFANSADPWLIAYARAHGCVVVTHEVSRPESQSSIKLPDAASEFDVNCTLPFEMLREMQVVLTLAK